MRRYGSEDNGRWIGFDHHPGDIVVSARSKCGTTWVQMICCLLIHQNAELPAPLGELAPWLDWPVEPLEQVRGRLAAQDHRRVIKTHLPLDGLPLHPEVTYIVVARHPLDVAVSLFHHVQNLDQQRMAALTGKAAQPRTTGSIDGWLDHWIDERSDPLDALDTLPGNLHHLADAWSRRVQPNMVLLHYEDLGADLSGQMRSLADRLKIDVPAARWPELIGAARFDAMSARAEVTNPDHVGILRDRQAFFRSGTSGEGKRLCTTAQLDRYQRRVVELAEPDLLAGLHREPCRG